MSEPVRRAGLGTAARSHQSAGTAVSDGRLLRGARTRQTIARHAAEVASLEGLNGLSFGRLAADLGLSKSGVQALLRTKEILQAAVECLRAGDCAGQPRRREGRIHRTGASR